MSVLAARVLYCSSAKYCALHPGFLNYDRSNKFTASQTAAIHKANQAIIKAAAALPENHL
jgi:hypothetical protein